MSFFFFFYQNENIINDKIKENFFSYDESQNEVQENYNIFLDNSFYKCIEPQNENITKISTQESIKRGRKPTEYNYLNKKKHDKFECNNIRCKIKNNCFIFLINFLNDKIREIFGYQMIKFRKINYKYINIRNKKENYLLLNKQIKDILSLDISLKYKNKNEKQNVITLNKIYSFLSKYLDLKFEDFYKEYFLKKYSPNDNKSKAKDFFDFINLQKENYLKKLNLSKYDPFEIQEKFEEINNYINKVKKIGEEYIDFYKKYGLKIKK